MALTYEPHLLRLSDDVILHIMSYLKLKDVLSLAQVCSRLEKISKDRTLWREADLRPLTLSRSELEDAVRCCFHRGTKVLASTGSARSPACKDPSSSAEHADCLSPALFDLVMQATNLETLILEEHFINASTLPYRCFPSSLKHLSMENCQMINAPVKESYFYNMACQTPLLESLNLSGCSWFEDHSMMAISKCPRLKTLRLRGCAKVGTCAAYIFLSARFGFEKIEVLDLRETAVSDSEIRAFKSKPNLCRLYVDGRFHRRTGSDQPDRVGDIGLNLPEELAPNLQVLVLTNTEVTDLTLRHMSRNMPNLKLVDLRGTRVTEPGVVRLKTEFPSLKILCDFDEQTADLSTIPEADEWWLDRQFVRQEEVKQPLRIMTAGPSTTDGGSSAGPARHERIEIIAVEPGLVRLRRVFDRAPQPRQQEAEPLAEPVPEEPEQPQAAADEPPPADSSPPPQQAQSSNPDDAASNEANLLSAELEQEPQGAVAGDVSPSPPPPSSSRSPRPDAPEHDSN